MWIRYRQTLLLKMMPIPDSNTLIFGDASKTSNVKLFDNVMEWEQFCIGLQGYFVACAPNHDTSE